MIHKENKPKRIRNKELGIKVSSKEFERLLKVCKKLGVTKVQFLINAIEQEEQK